MRRERLPPLPFPPPIVRHEVWTSCSILHAASLGVPRPRFTVDERGHRLSQPSAPSGRMTVPVRRHSLSTSSPDMRLSASSPPHTQPAVSVTQPTPSTLPMPNTPAMTSQPPQLLPESQASQVSQGSQVSPMLQDSVETSMEVEGSKDEMASK